MLNPTEIFTRYNLRPDKGWPETAVQDIATSGRQAAWLEMMDYLRSLPHYKTSHQLAETLCFEDPHNPPQPPPEAGTDAFRQTLRSAGPPAEWLDDLHALLANLAGEAIERIPIWIRAATRSSTGHLNRPGANRELLQALLWSSLLLPSENVIDALRQLATATAGKTMQAVTILMILGVHESEPALAALHLLAQQAKRPTPRNRAQRMAEHLARRLGISPADAAERSIPSFDLSAEGTLNIALDNYFGELRIEDRKAQIHYLTANREELKALSVTVKKKYAAELSGLKSTAKSVDTLLAAQRTRIETLLTVRRAWPMAQFQQLYLQHPVVAPIAKSLIWNLTARGTLQNAIFHNGRFVCSDDTVAETRDASVTLWHPLSSTPDEIHAWRVFLEEHHITQPFKQAHREIYLLTDAEHQTATYSNRFAAHVIRQHQFNQLAKARGWDFGLLGNWDAGQTGIAARILPASEIRVEFWVNLVDAQYTELGIALAVGTDQVRFYRPGGTTPIPLVEIPPLAFSETMRDVDLFVGVCSIGNDPTWNDGGPEGRFRNYWQSYSFGDLTATAQTRKEVLQRLIPRLAIAGQCTFSDRFLIVRGTRRTYKIHLGSGNILMDPNDQYLCIVADRSPRTDANVFLPFEGDTTLAVILSKALLLAQDQEITDPTILRQISTP